jgi:hypothetical protein
MRGEFPQVGASQGEEFLQAGAFQAGEGEFPSVGVSPEEGGMTAAELLSVGVSPEEAEVAESPPAGSFL